MGCPACNAKSGELRRTIVAPDIDGVTLHNAFSVYECQDCGHGVSQIEDRGISDRNAMIGEYYLKNYKSGKYSSPVGSKVEFDAADPAILVLSQKSEYLQDIWIKTIAEAHNEGFVYTGLKKDIISLDHFLEHCFNPARVLAEITWALHDTGLLHIAVPDYGRYKETVFDEIPYFFLIKEHFQHFTERSLVKLASRLGFWHKETVRGKIELFDGKLKMPVLDVFFRRFNPDGLYLYGAGRELGFLMNNSDRIKSLDISGIIDDTSMKQGRSINGIRIFSSEIIPQLSQNSGIEITARFYQDEIEEKLSDMQYKGKIWNKKEKKIKDEKKNS
jgi:hypothetical protein